MFREIKSLKLDHDFNKKLWMTNPKSVQFKLHNVKLFNFPSNTTCELQLMDPGFIKNLNKSKSNFQTRVIFFLNNNVKLSRVT